MNVSDLPFLASLNVGAFSPLDISNIIGWWDASDISTITKDGGDLVSQWDDKSGNNNDLVQVTGGDQPLWVENGQNSLDTIDFTGNSHMKVDYADLTQPVSIFTTLDVADVAGQQSIIDGFLGAGASFGFIKSSDNTNMSIIAPTNLKWSKTGMTDAFVQFSLIYNTTSSITRADGSEEATGTVGTNAQTGLTIGEHRNGGSESEPEIGEIVVYNKAVSGAELASIENYLTTKWIP